VGAGAVQVMVWLGPALARPEILGLAIGLSAMSASIALRIGSAYRGVLERGLVRRAELVPDLAGETVAIGDSLLGTVFTNLPVIPAAAVANPEPARARVDTGDGIAQSLAELRSADVQRVLPALGAEQTWNPILAAQVIQLLAWDPVSQAARAYLERGGDRITGQLTDALLDPDVEFGIRRRVPRLLARCGTARGVEGLIQGLHDPRFEVRFQCGRALDYIRQHQPQIEFRPAEIYQAVERELSVSKTIWRSWKVLDKRESSDGYSYLDDLLRERADQSLEHVFSLLAVVLPREPLMAAFRGLHEEDRIFRGLALEYLETVLPPKLRERLWIILEESPAQSQAADPVEEKALLETLLRTSARLELKLKQEST
jgi:AAA family ATP:ADP antiporter